MEYFIEAYTKKYADFTGRARRLHDINMSGWWQLLSLIPYVGPLAVFIFTLLPGNQGPNRFGADPLFEANTTSTIVPPEEN